MSEYNKMSHEKSEYRISNRNILIVTDNCEFGRLLADYFSLTNTIRITCSNRHGSSIISGFLPDIIINDIDGNVHPEINLARILRGIPSLCRIPVLIISGADDDIAEANSGRNSAFSLLRKPVNLRELEQTIINILMIKLGK